MNLEKYRALFLEEATEHLAELSRALLALEKNSADVEAIDAAFRMAHSIKGMAASLDYQGPTELAHKLEDLLAARRAAGAVDARASALLFRALEGLEKMVAALRATGEPPLADATLIAELSGPPVAATESPPKKPLARRP
jgi:two-component system chemotaxis sensor kinase CheA